MTIFFRDRLKTFVICCYDLLTNSRFFSTIINLLFFFETGWKKNRFFLLFFLIIWRNFLFFSVITWRNSWFWKLISWKFFVLSFKKFGNFCCDFWTNLILFCANCWNRRFYFRHRLSKIAVSIRSLWRNEQFFPRPNDELISRICAKKENCGLPRKWRNISGRIIPVKELT